METILIKPKLKMAGINLWKPNKNYSNDSALCIGRYDAKHLYRILMYFPLTLFPEDVVIIEALIKVFVAVTGPVKKNEYKAYVLDQSWSADSVTWNNQPSYDSLFCTEGISISKSGQYCFTITDMVTEWISNPNENCGLLLKNNEAVDGEYAKILAINTGGYAPVIEIKYMPSCTCKCKCTVVPTEFIEKKESMNITSLVQYSRIMDTSLNKANTYFVKNTGTSVIIAQVEISPNKVDFIAGNGSEIIEPGKMIPILPYYYAKYARIAAKALNFGEKSSLELWYQAQK